MGGGGEKGKLGSPSEGGSEDSGGKELRDSPTSTTDLLGDLGQLPSPVWASVSSSVN